ncbi:MAG: hypothetical protein GC134_01285 [Proteobacteria bacterium]|nr:hypothetical protein [Pseudomonadota bacterium]
MPIKGSKYTGIAVGGALLVFLAVNNRLSEHGYDVYPAKAPDSISELSPVHFTESAQQLGLVAPNRFYYPNTSPKAKQYEPLLSLSPSVSVADVNGDGFMDVYVTAPAPDIPNKLFINHGGKSFEEVAAKVGLDDTDRTYKEPSMAYWGDFNHDGKLDVFMARYGCHTLHTQQADGTFKAALVGYCSQPWSINVFDFNRDGNLDVFFGNYYHAEDLSKYVALEHIFTRAGLPKTGSANAILLGKGDGTFGLLDDGVLKDYPDHTAAVGFSDVNMDGYPDIAVSNDYNPDRMYLNQGGKTLKEVTEQSIPSDKHGFNDMNAEFVDFDMDGLIDLFVTGGFGPPISVSDNLLWKRKSNDSTEYEEVARKWNAHGCGSAWTAKFSDFDNNGDLDFFIINGQGYGANVKDPKDAKSYNYVRNEIRSTPGSLRYTLDSMPDFSNYEMWAFQHSCVMWQKDGQFYDVAQKAGVADYTEDGRSLALVDLNNDGKQDVLVVNMNAPMYVFINDSKTDGNWVGISAIWEDGTVATGARLMAKRTDGKPLVREVFPGNGHHSQNDPRIHFGLGKAKLADDEIAVLWPDGTMERFTHQPMNTYVTLVHGKGVK